MRLYTIHIVAMFALTLPAVGLSGASLAEAEATQPLKRVEQGVADTNPLRVSRRELGQDLRQPSGFRDVFEVTPGNDPSQRRFVRRNGAVFAVFPRSIYQFTDQGVAVPVPPGTIYYVGGLPPELARAASESIIAGGGRVSRTSATSLTRSDPRADTADTPGLRGAPAHSFRLAAGSDVRPIDPAAMPTREFGHTSPRVWTSSHTGPSIMSDEAERARAVTRVLATLRQRTSQDDTAGKRNALGPSALPD